MLINGKTLEQIRMELAIFEKKAGEKEGKPYYKHWQFKKRLDSVFGLNYSTEYSQVQVVECGKQVLLSCVCTITIHADGDLKPVIKRSGVGGREFIAYRTGEGYTNFQSTPSFVERAAFCEACKEFGMFGNCKDDEEAGDGVVMKPSKVNNSSNNNSNYKRGTFVTHSVMTSVAKGNGEVTYFLNVVSGAEEKEVVFYNNQYKKVGDVFEKFRAYLPTADLVKGVTVDILYTEGSKGGLVFRGFLTKEG